MSEDSLLAFPAGQKGRSLSGQFSFKKNEFDAFRGFCLKPGGIFSVLCLQISVF